VERLDSKLAGYTFLEKESDYGIANVDASSIAQLRRVIALLCRLRLSVE